MALIEQSLERGVMDKEQALEIHKEIERHGFLMLADLTHWIMEKDYNEAINALECYVNTIKEAQYKLSK